MSTSEIVETRQYLTFRLGDEVFALDVEQVREVLDQSVVTPIPRTPRFMAGVINLRGSVVPVVDLRVCFDMMPAPAACRTCIVVVEVLLENEPIIIGALADSVEEVVDIEPGQIEPPPRIGTHIRTDFIRGIGKQSSGFVVILDCDRVFSGYDLARLCDAASEATPEHALG